ncbi:hypothetical protein MPER_00438, partial [Moniliophthora perniciosa FA553]
ELRLWIYYIISHEMGYRMEDRTDVVESLYDPLTLEEYRLGIRGDNVEREEIESRSILHGNTMISIRRAPGSDSGSFVYEIQKHRKPALSIKLDFGGYLHAMRAYMTM